MRQIRLSVADAISDGETESLHEDLLSVFSDEDVEEIERRIDSGDFYDFVTEILDEWSGEDIDELLELLEAQLAEADVDLKYSSPEADDDDEDDDDDSDDDDDEIIADDEDEEDDDDDL